MTLHTAAGCTMTKGNTVDGTELSETGDCNAGSGGTGCPQTTNSTSNFGKGLNAQGGGVYAMLWDNEAISVWFFPRNSTMQNRITSSNSTIDPTAFGTPLASFVGGSTCNIENTFKEHWITINTDFVSFFPSLLTKFPGHLANTRLAVWSMGWPQMVRGCRVRCEGSHLRGIRGSRPQRVRRRIL